MGSFLDISTLLVVGMLASAVAAGALGMLWRCDRCQSWLGALALALLAGSLATALFVAAPAVPVVAGWMPAIVGNAVLALAYGLAWRAFQIFDDRPRSVLGVAFGAVAWLPFLALPLLRDMPGLAASLSAGVVGVYSLAVAWQLYAGGWREPLPARTPTAVLFALHGVGYLARVPLSAFFPPTIVADGSHSPWFVAATLESLLLTMALVVAVMVLASQRAAVCHRRAELTDPLTGLPNRRAFFQTVGPMIEQSSGDGVLMVFDLDHFHLVNDRFGRVAGDEVLVAVAAALRSEVQAPDVFARIGDEEFALFMPSVGADVGIEVAEYLCRKVEALRVTIADVRVPITTSIGVAAVSDAGRDVEALGAGANAALAESKRIGRNRVRAYRKASHLQDLIREAWRKTG